MKQIAPVDRIKKGAGLLISLLALATFIRIFAPGSMALAATADGVGAVYAMTNSLSGNQVVIFRRAANGTLTPAGTVATGGLGGTSPGLGTQGALILSEGKEWLFAVNTGSDDISVFKVRANGGLSLVDRVASGGRLPASLTFHERTLYVLNEGGDGAGSITGFKLSPEGKLKPLAGSTRPLSASAAHPAQVGFNRDGSVLVVTEKATNKIDTYLVGDDRRASEPTVQNSSGQTPFGFAFSKRDRPVISEAFTDTPGLGAMSSYLLSSDGTLQVVSGTVRNTQGAACWVVITNDGRFAYVSNTRDGNISRYKIHRDGSITLREAIAGTTGAGSSPTDMALSENSRYLYSLNFGSGTISAFRVETNGSLTLLQTIGGLPARAGAQGLAAR